MTIRRRRSTRPPSVRWNIFIPADIAAIIDNSFWSHVYQKPMYGKRQELVIELLRAHIAQNNLAALPLRLGAPEGETSPSDEERDLSDMASLHPNS